MSQLRRQNELRNEKGIKFPPQYSNTEDGVHTASGFIEEQNANCSYGQKGAGMVGVGCLLCRSAVTVHAIVTAIIAVRFVVIINITALHVIIIIEHIVHVVATTCGLHVKGSFLLHCCTVLLHCLRDFHAVFLGLFQRQFDLLPIGWEREEIP